MTRIRFMAIDTSQPGDLSVLAPFDARRIIGGSGEPVNQSGLSLLLGLVLVINLTIYEGNRPVATPTEAPSASSGSCPDKQSAAHRSVRRRVLKHTQGYNCGREQGCRGHR
ncbi:hypothetical protein NITLEN_10612 [Nitrospira lenta]|uniref:Uncharacterized protein n=1 Tax=Nitrospira lenta TaxID=1436998 RepID=A0A330L9D0_9BACT|nr:hypothetical protein NITLEN_10612 [Nitrospira lenta]